MASQFPLRTVTTGNLQRLGQVLWSWSICVDCLAGKSCDTEGCPWPRSTLVNRFFELYKELTSNYDSRTETDQTSCLKSHEDLFTIIQKVRSNPDITRVALMEKLFADRPARHDQERAVNLAVHLILMVNCGASRQSSILAEYGSQQPPWKNDVTLTDFVTGAFPQERHPSIGDIKENLRATKLKKLAHLDFHPTDNLRNHLKLDKETAVVEIFHHTAFLKEQLRLTKDKPTLTVAECIKLGVLPRALTLETLDSLQKVLFPITGTFTEKKSKALLLSLTSTSNFDKDILRYDSSSIRSTAEDDVPYHYFGTRLGDLYEEMMNPTPRGFEKWLERNSGARSIMMATLAGVILAILLGILSLGLGGFQAWVGYQAWKHPVSPPESTGS